jgi:hypothetical protein
VSNFEPGTSRPRTRANSIVTLGKCKGLPVTYLMAQSRTRGTALLILNLGAIWWWVVYATSRHLYPRGAPIRRLRGRQVPSRRLPMMVLIFPFERIIYPYSLLPNTNILTTHNSQVKNVRTQTCAALPEPHTYLITVLPTTIQITVLYKHVHMITTMQLWYDTVFICEGKKWRRRHVVKKTSIQ